MDKFLKNTLIKAGETPQGQDVLDYLAARRATPELRMRYLGDGTSGEFAYNGWLSSELPRNGQVTLNEQYDNFQRKPSENAVATLVHELTHAATRQLHNQYADTRKNPGSAQFRDAYEKMVFRNADSTAQKMAPEWMKKGENYRTSSTELTSFGVGNTVLPETASQAAPPHVDTTLAQERAILQEIALRDILKQPPKGR